MTRNNNDYPRSGRTFFFVININDFVKITKDRITVKI